MDGVTAPNPCLRAFISGNAAYLRLPWFGLRNDDLPRSLLNDLVSVGSLHLTSRYLSSLARQMCAPKRLTPAIRSKCPPRAAELRGPTGTGPLLTHFRTGADYAIALLQSAFVCHSTDSRV